jgi:serine/threonine-protein kinase
VHRDIKPENILLGSDHALVADFGIARAIGSATAAQAGERALSGTPAYMSPEQARGEPAVDERTDIYALGCVLHEMLTGEPPFTGPTVEAVIAQRLNGPAPRISTTRADISPALEAAIARALARDAADRFSSARQLGEALAATEPSSAPTRRARSRTGWIGAVAATLLAVTGWFGWQRPGLPPAANRLPSVAVLPFQDLGDSTHGYFAQGVAEQLNGALVRIERLAVRPSATVRAEVAKGGDPATLGRRLEADYVVDGNVRRSGGRLRVSLEIVEVNAGSTTWSRTYEGRDADIFSIQESAASQVASVLSLRLKPVVRAALVRRTTADPVAHDRYLQATHVRNDLSREGAERAVALYEQAIARDSNFADAWAGLAAAYHLLAQLGGPTPSEIQVAWRRAIERAIVLDSLSGEAYGQRAQFRSAFEWDYQAADRDFRRTVALSPGSADAYLIYAQFLNVIGLDDSALVVMRRGVELSPTDGFRVANLGARLRMVGRTTEAAIMARRALAMDSTVWLAYLVLSEVAHDKGRLADAALEAERAHRIAGDLPFVLGTLGRHYGGAGRRIDAESTLARLTRLERDQYVERVFRAEALVGVNDRPGALGRVGAVGRPPRAGSPLEAGLRALRAVAWGGSIRGAA